MFFKVLDPRTVDITDPETGNILGSISRIKIVLKAAEVAEHLTVAQTFRSHEVNVGGTGNNLLGSLMSPPKYVRQVETLRRGAGEPAPIAERESVVAIGDPFEAATSQEVESSRSVSLWREAVEGESLVQSDPE